MTLNINGGSNGINSQGTYVNPNKYQTFNRGVANRWKKNPTDIEPRHFENKLLLTFEQFKLYEQFNKQAPNDDNIGNSSSNKNIIHVFKFGNEEYKHLVNKSVLDKSANNVINNFDMDDFLHIYNIYVDNDDDKIVSNNTQPIDFTLGEMLANQLMIDMFPDLEYDGEEFSFDGRPGYSSTLGLLYDIFNNDDIEDIINELKTALRDEIEDY